MLVNTTKTFPLLWLVCMDVHWPTHLRVHSDFSGAEDVWLQLVGSRLSSVWQGQPIIIYQRDEGTHPSTMDIWSETTTASLLPLTREGFLAQQPAVRLLKRMHRSCLLCGGTCNTVGEGPPAELTCCSSPLSPAQFSLSFMHQYI